MFIQNIFLCIWCIWCIWHLHLQMLYRSLKVGRCPGQLRMMYPSWLYQRQKEVVEERKSATQICFIKYKRNSYKNTSQWRRRLNTFNFDLTQITNDESFSNILLQYRCATRSRFKRLTTRTIKYSRWTPHSSSKLYTHVLVSPMCFVWNYMKCKSAAKPWYQATISRSYSCSCTAPFQYIELPL